MEKSFENVFHDIPGTEGMYTINCLGEIRKYQKLDFYAFGKYYDFRYVKNMKLSTDSSGYKFVRLSGKRYSIHRLLATLFIPNPENKPQVNHINGVRSDYRLSNLEWATSKENMQHAYRELKNVGTGRKLTEADVIYIRSVFRKSVWGSIPILKEKFGVSENTIREAALGRLYVNTESERNAVLKKQEEIYKSLNA